MARPLGPGESRKRVVHLPSAEELAIQRNREASLDPTIARRYNRSRNGGYAMSAEDAIGAASLMDRSRVISPFSGLPTASSGGEFYEAIEFFGKDLYGDDAPWSEYYEYTQSGYQYQNLAKQYGAEEVFHDDVDNEPAQLSLVPTSTINPKRPRTVAAGYDPQRGVLTVMFRDGTLYNYQTVSSREWQAFKQSKSKGRYIRRVLDWKDRGVADVAQVPYYAREALYRIARTSQWIGMPHATTAAQRKDPRYDPRRAQGNRTSAKIPNTATKIRKK